MIEVIGCRGSGKTTELISIAYENRYTIVTPTKRNAEYVKETSKKLGKDVRIICISEFLNNRELRNSAGYIIDELDAFLSSLGVVGYSKSIESLKIVKEKR